MSEPVPIYKNTLIQASAGCGKTYALVTRLVRCLLAGVSPEEIVALTFTRTAAGEIFIRLVSRLAECATPGSNAIEALLNSMTAEEKEKLAPDGTIAPERFRKLLRQVVASQHISQVGTIDSFMMRIVQVFPLEMGFQGSIEIIDEHQLKQDMAQICRALLLQPGEIFQKWRRCFLANFNAKEKKNYFNDFIETVEKLHNKYLSNPDENIWRGAEKLWKKQDRSEVSQKQFDEFANILIDLPETFSSNKTFKSAWKTFTEAVRSSRDSIPYENSIFKNNFEKKSFPIEILYNRKPYVLPKPQSDAFIGYVKALFSHWRFRALQHTRGLYELLSRFDAEWHHEIRGRGRLVFDDIPRAIHSLSELTRQDVEYRLDGRFGQWALDEFQDTSREQWGAISRLLNEASADEGAGRSVFIVGDCKQAIFGWRNGDVGIFSKLIEDESYRQECLSRSWRYSPYITKVVNAIFCPSNVRDSSGLDKGSRPNAVSRWAELWMTHESAKDIPGCVTWKDANGKSNSPDFVSPIAELLEGICEPPSLDRKPRSVRKGKTCMLLFRSNSKGEQISAELRARGFNVVWEGESAVLDTSCIANFMHILKLSDYSGNKLAWQALKDSPFAPLLQENPEETSAHIRTLLTKHGLARTLRILWRELEALEVPFNDFEKQRLSQMFHAAAQFEQILSPADEWSSFADFLRDMTDRNFADSGAIRGLTVHRSKGLEADIVIYPMDESKGIEFARGDIISGDGWLLHNVHRWLCKNDATLSHAYLDAEQKELYESICLHYVAMTRARHALHLIFTPSAKSNSETIRFCDVAREGLKNFKGQSLGDANWLDNVPSSDTQSTENKTGPLPAIKRRKRRELKRGVPSETICEQTADQLFRPAGQTYAAKERGIAIHDALSKIEWLNGTQPAGIAKSIIDLTIPSPFRTALEKKEGDLPPWRERAFETVANGVWTSGIFDRVVINEKPNGTRTATIYDYKTNRIRSDETPEDFEHRMQDTYRTQLSSYRDALAILTNIPKSQISCTLLLTATSSALKSL